MSTPSKKTSWFWVWLFVLVVVPVAVMASWAGTEYLIKKSSGAEFCTTCHTMERMGSTFASSTHGGNNRLGFRAKCADCHLPHDNAANYLFTKIKTGMRDMWAQLTYDPERPTDWREKRKQRHHYVFDSGCMKCHSDKASGKDPAHPAYFAGGASPFAGQDKFRCVDCHFYVGHSLASAWIKTSEED